MRAIRTGRPGDAKRALDPYGEQVDHPRGFPCFNCPFVRACWDGWEPEPAGVLPDDLHGVVVELASVEDQLAKVKSLPMLEARRDELRAKLRGRLRPATNYRAPGFDKVRVIEVAGRRTFSLKDFEAAGHALPDVAEDFIRTGAGHDRWYITREQAS